MMPGMTDGRASDPTIDRAMRVFGELRQLDSEAPMLAPASDRVMARIIDGVLAFVVFAIVGYAASALTFAIDGPAEADPYNPARVLPTEHTTEIGWAAMAVFGALLLLNEVVLVARSGSSLGKRRLGMRVVDAETHAPATLRQAAIRFAVWVVPLLAALLVWSLNQQSMLGMFAVIVGLAVVTVIPSSLVRQPSVQGLHDRIAGTAVIVPRR